MARRKSHRRRSTRRRRMGATAALSQDKIMKALGAIGGVVAIGFANEQVAKMTTPPDPKLVALGEVLIGFFLPTFVKNNPLIEGVGLGMIAAGGFNAAKDLGIVSGMPIVSGYGSLHVVNGLPAPVKKYIEPKQRTTASQVITGVMQNNYDQ